MFRKLKIKLLRNKAFVNYLKYALGEILLVMIGILLAIQINNANENRKNRDKESLILHELHKDFTENLDKFQILKQLQYQTFHNGEIVFRNLDKMDVSSSRDSVYRHVTGMFGGYHYYPSNGLVESLISTGDIQLISNDTLRKYLVSWNDVLKNYTERVAIDVEFWANQVEPYVIRHGNFYEINSIENKKLVEDPVFINMLVRKQHYNSNVVSAIDDDNGIAFCMQEIVRLTTKD